MKAKYARRIREAILMAKEDVRKINAGETQDIVHKFDDDLQSTAYRATFIKLDIVDGVEYFVAVETKDSFEGIHDDTHYWRTIEGSGGTWV